MKDLNYNKSREHKFVNSYNPVLSSLGERKSSSVVYLMADPVWNRCSASIFLPNIPLGRIFDRKITGLVPTVRFMLIIEAAASQ